MERLPWRGTREWTLEERFERIAAAGFDGVSIDGDHPRLEEAVSLAAAHGLGWYASLILGSVEAFADSLEIVVPLRPAAINLQPAFLPATLEEAVPVFREWVTLAAAADLPLRVETHRDRATMDLPFTLALLDELPQLELTADLSHYVVARDWPMPARREDQAQIARILDRTSAFHGRVAASGQVQIALAFPQSQPWLELFLKWWDDGLRRWRARGEPGGTLIFTVELGPPPYAITGPDGEELSDRWQEATTLRELVHERWSRIEAGG
jgi:hypothetical protein